jgi:hypothetical protein
MTAFVRCMGATLTYKNQALKMAKLDIRQLKQAAKGKEPRRT